MANIVPLHNKNIVALCRLLEEVPAGGDDGLIASANGDEFTSTLREQYMQWAYTRLPLKYRDALGSAVVEWEFPGLIFEKTSSMASPVTLNEDVALLLDVRKSGSTSVFLRSGKNSIDQEVDPFKDNVYTVVGKTVTLYRRVSGVYTAWNSGDAIVRYIKSERIDSSTGAVGTANTLVNGGDITIDLKWHQPCVLYAAYFACMEHGGEDRINMGQRFLSELKQMVHPEVAKILV